MKTLLYFILSSAFAEVFWHAGNPAFSEDLQYRETNLRLLSLPGMEFALFYESLEANNTNSTGNSTGNSDNSTGTGNSTDTGNSTSGNSTGTGNATDTGNSTSGNSTSTGNATDTGNSTGTGNNTDTGNSTGSSSSSNSSNTGNMTDGIFGAAYALSPLPPLNYLSYFNDSSIWDNNTANPTLLANLTEAQSVIGVTYLSLTEVDANGTDIASIHLSSLQWRAGPIKVSGPMEYAIVTGTDPEVGNFTISLTFATANTSGTLTNGDIITPKSILTMVNILDYSLTSPNSQLRLTLALATASNSEITPVDESSQLYHLSAGSGNATVYFDGAKQSFVDNQGTTNPVIFNTSEALIGDFEGASIVQQLEAMRQAQSNVSLNFTLINITFPRPAFNLTYAFSIGMGTFNASNISLDNQPGVSSSSGMSSGMSSGSSGSSGGSSTSSGSASGSSMSSGSSGSAVSTASALASAASSALSSAASAAASAASSAASGLASTQQHVGLVSGSEMNSGSENGGASGMNSGSEGGLNSGNNGGPTGLGSGGNSGVGGPLRNSGDILRLPLALLSTLFVIALKLANL